MKFFRYRQNNSGGSFHEDNNVTIAVYIEANDANEANWRAEDIGIYFDGCSSGVDCSCCGDRWRPAWEYSNAIDIQELKESIASDYVWKWHDLKYVAIVHPKNGTPIIFRNTYNGELQQYKSIEYEEYPEILKNIIDKKLSVL